MEWVKYVALHKEWHINKESLKDHGYSGIVDGTYIHHFLQGIQSLQLEVAMNVVQAQQEKCGKDVDATVSYLCQIVAKNGYNM